jgi:uncharacterized protein YjiS (DUF1127 family)
MAHSNRANTASTIRCPAHSRLPRLGIDRLLQWSWATLHSMVARSRQRSALGDLDDRLLSDIGVTRFTARRESTKPFWRS